MWKPEHRRAAERRGLRYPSDLTDAEWALVEPMIPPAKRGGRRREVNVREVLNAIFYVLSTGRQWQALISRENAFNPPMSSHGRSGGALIRPQHRNLISNKNHNCNAKLVRADCDPIAIKCGGSFPAAAAAAGIVCIFQELSLMPDLSVADNVSITSPPRRFGMIDTRAQRRRAEALLAEVGCEDVNPLLRVRDLPLSRRQMVEIAKALGQKPRGSIFGALILRVISFFFRIFDIAPLLQPLFEGVILPAAVLRVKNTLELFR